MSFCSKIPYKKLRWPLNFWAKYYEEPSIYDQKMKRLSCKIFNEYYEKPIPRDLARSQDHLAKRTFISKLIQDYNLIARVSTQPIDLDDNRNANYYPAHPQIRALTFKLREYGLFRDEHLDFKEEMKRLNTLRGKPFRKLGGGGGKRSKN